MKNILSIALFLMFTATVLAQSDSALIAPSIKLLSSKGDTVQLSDFKGKVVFIDFWASWCPPCRAEMKYSKKLAEKFKDNSSVVFLYVSIDSKMEKWKKAMVDLNMTEGINLISLAGKQDDISIKYDLKSIPRYVLIDKNGSIADSNAKRPSERGVAKDIEDLLK